MGMVTYFLYSTQETVIATCRDPKGATSLHALEAKFNVNGMKRLTVLQLDVTSAEGHRSVVSSLSAAGIDSIDILILNAGIANSTHPHDDFMTCTVEDMTNVYHTNVVGTLLSLQSYHPLVMKSAVKVVVVMSSNLGSITNHFGGFTSYRASKCALNMLAVTYSKDTEIDSSNGCVLCLHPGWVQTDMGNADGRTADISVEESVGTMMQVVYWAVLCSSGRGSGRGSGSMQIESLEREHEALMRSHDNKTTMQSREYREVVLQSKCSFLSQDGTQIGW